MENQPQKMEGSVYELTPDEQATINEYQQAIRDIQQQAQGAMRMILKLRHLEGNWSLDGNRLVKR